MGAAAYSVPRPLPGFSELRRKCSSTWRGSSPTAPTASRSFSCVMFNLRTQLSHAALSFTSMRSGLSLEGVLMAVSWEWSAASG
jgi:hypothetical protein